ncbi:phosphate signaling complex protein PhoU [Paraflavisolibacter sp. H34]|uniref:phosphate signaling complex protein PhoU n=1 Tax=Huijunlia imazamoxiresistens TaxID=3127457 RepID=UPI003019D00F
MSHLESDIKAVREGILLMWDLVLSQLQKSLSSLLNFDKDLAREVVFMEKRVNATEIQIDWDCENVFALFSPVAIDLRFLLAILKINSNLERTGDIAEAVAKFVINADQPFAQDLLDKTQVIEMFDAGIRMLEETKGAFQAENTALARGIFAKDETLDKINRSANENVIDYLKVHPEDIDQALYALSIIRKLERIGDQAKNIAEEIIFYVEAKVIKHSHKK